MLDNKNIVITGANRGIGRAISETCIRQRANVWLCMRSYTDETEQWMKDMSEVSKGFIKHVELSLEDEESIKSASSAILKEKLSIDGIVNNAGIAGTPSLFSMTGMDEIMRVFQVNFFGPMLFTQRLLKRMMHQKSGSIVNISSMASIDGEPGQFAYVSSKAAVNGATKKLANELGQFGVRVNAIAPGVTETAMIELMTDDTLEKTLNRTSLKRPGKAGEIANLCGFLLSDESSYMTGQVIRIDGGSY